MFIRDLDKKKKSLRYQLNEPAYFFELTQACQIVRKKAIKSTKC